MSKPIIIESSAKGALDKALRDLKTDLRKSGVLEHYHRKLEHVPKSKARRNKRSRAKAQRVIDAKGKKWKAR